MGTGGHAQEIADAVAASMAVSVDDAISNLHCIGRVGPEAQFVGGRLSTPWLGEDAILAELPRSVRFVLGVGAPPLRRALWEQVSGLGFLPVPAVRHRTSVVSRDLDAAAGCVIASLVGITNNVRLDAGVLIQQGASIGHEATIGRFSAINPNAAISGRVRIGEGVMIGAQAVVLEGRAIGDGARVGAGAVVTRDVPPGATVVGNPARVTN